MRGPQAGAQNCSCIAVVQELRLDPGGTLVRVAGWEVKNMSRALLLGATGSPVDATAHPEPIGQMQQQQQPLARTGSFVVSLKNPKESCARLPIQPRGHAWRKNQDGATAEVGGTR